MGQFVRAFFRCEDDETSNLMVDLFINEERRILDRVPMFGFWGRLKSSEMWPFVLHNHEIDFGEQFDPDDPSAERLPRDERYADIDLSGRIIAVGERFTLTYHREFWNLRLEKITDIAAL